MNDAATRILELLRQARSFESRSADSPGASTGTVACELSRESVITREVGQSHYTCSATSNAYRWTLSPDYSRLDLAHLRLGPSRPVNLVSFDLSNPRALEDGGVEYRSGLPHRCGDDLYSATLTLEAPARQAGDLSRPGDLVLRWRIVGPHKDQRIVTRYSSNPQDGGLHHQESHPAGDHVVKM